MTIQDNGVGISPEKLAELRLDMQSLESVSSTSIGLHNTALRMHLLFGENFRIDIQSTIDVGTSITLEFPILE